MGFRRELLLAVAGFALISGGVHADDGRTARYESAPAKASSVSKVPAPDFNRTAQRVSKRAANDYRENYTGASRPVVAATGGVVEAPVVIDLTAPEDRANPPPPPSRPQLSVRTELPPVPVEAVVSEPVSFNAPVAPAVNVPAAPFSGGDISVSASTRAPVSDLAAEPVFSSEISPSNLSGKAETIAVTEVTSFEPASGGDHVVAAPVSAVKSSGAHWGYVGAESAQHWGGLHSEYAACSEGQKQSPVNISQFAKKDLPTIGFSYAAAPLVVVNNGHTIQVDYSAGSAINVGGQNFKLAQFHFHTPSEHYLDGSPYPMEVHFVHKSDSGQLAVVGAMMKIGAANPVIENIWKNAPTQKGSKSVEAVQVNAADLLPQSKDYYAYEGSLTTPPCSEGVLWHVLKSPIEISQQQLQIFQALFPVNARPVQPLAGRVVRGN